MLCFAPGGGLLTSPKDFETERARLAKLPRAARFDELLDFPTRHLFKVIGPKEGLSVEVRRALSSLGFGEHLMMTERYSSSGWYLSLTFELEVVSGQQLDDIYRALEAIDNASYVL